ncbi:MAG: hypothetical protein KDK39_02675 [Leptospiraceae bacterium]|nr:hypothetical protein [Leptospiraceae bacterium]
MIWLIWWSYLRYNLTQLQNHGRTNWARVVSKSKNKGFKGPVHYYIKVLFDVYSPGFMTVADRTDAADTLSKQLNQLLHPAYPHGDTARGIDTDLKPKSPRSGIDRSAPPGAEYWKALQDKAVADPDYIIQLQLFITEREFNQAMINRPLLIRYVPGFPDLITSQAGFERAQKSAIAAAFWWPLGSVFLAGLLMLFSNSIWQQWRIRKSFNKTNSSPGGKRSVRTTAGSKSTNPEKLPTTANMRGPGSIPPQRFGLWWRRWQNHRRVPMLETELLTGIREQIQNKELVIMVTDALPYAGQIQTDLQSKQIPSILYRTQGDKWLFEDLMIFIGKTVSVELAWSVIQILRPYEPRYIHIHDPFNWLLQQQVIWIGHLGQAPAQAHAYAQLADLPNVNTFRERMQWLSRDYKNRHISDYPDASHYFADLVKHADVVGIESARDHVKPEHIPLFLDWFQATSNRKKRLHLLQLMQDHLQSEIPEHRAVCLSIVQICSNNQEEEFWFSLATVLCILENDYQLFDKLIHNYNFCQDLARRYLSR